MKRILTWFFKNMLRRSELDEKFLDYRYKCTGEGYEEWQSQAKVTDAIKTLIEEINKEA